jgi:hypothetical protein
VRKLQLRDPDSTANGSIADRNVPQRVGDRFEKRRLVGWGQRFGCVGDMKELTFGKRYSVHRLLLEERHGRSSMRFVLTAAIS